MPLFHVVSPDMLIALVPLIIDHLDTHKHLHTCHFCSGSMIESTYLSLGAVFLFCSDWVRRYIGGIIAMVRGEKLCLCKKYELKN